MTDSKPVYEIPGAENIDGLNIGRGYFGIVFNRNLDDLRFKRGDDVLVATYPRTGTTWMCQIVSLLLADEETYEASKHLPLIQRVPFLEQKLPHNPAPFIDMLDQFPTPRANKTHLPFRFIKRWITEDRVKTIVTSRNPKDTLVSMFHFYKSLKGFGPFRGSWDDFFEHLKAGKQLYGDQLAWMQDWDRQRDDDVLLFVQYEALKADTLAEVRRVAAFLEIDVSEARLERVVGDVDIKAMTKGNTDFFDAKYVVEGEKFVRSGQVGEWRKYFSEEQNSWFDEKYKRGYLDLGIDVAYA